METTSLENAINRLCYKSIVSIGHKVISNDHVRFSSLSLRRQCDTGRSRRQMDIPRQLSGHSLWCHGDRPCNQTLVIT